MAGLIPQSFIDELLHRLDLVEVVDKRVRLKKAGRNYTACCPFHDEKTPSFSVSPEKQFYHCFGCGASGNAVGFVMAFDGLEFPQAIETLASVAGLTVPREEQTPEQRKKDEVKRDLYGLMEQAAEFFQKQLSDTQEAQAARDYLANRGVSLPVQADWGVGYSPNRWDGLLAAMQSRGWTEQQLIDAGLVVVNDDSGKRYDRFRGRVMFPIRDNRGRVIAFGGRVLGDEKPKYLNSPETQIFSKGRELYGLYQANKQRAKLARLVVVEGYMDVISLAQFNVLGAVATLGTAAGAPHLEQAFRVVDEIVFCFDGDNAGRRAAERAMHVTLPALKEGKVVKFLFLADGEDPDTYVRKYGAERFETLLEAAKPLSEYVFEVAQQGLELVSPEARSLFVSRALPLLAQLPEGIYRRQMFIDLSLRSGIDTQSLFEMASLQQPTERSTKLVSSKSMVKAVERAPSFTQRPEFDADFSAGFDGAGFDLGFGGAPPGEWGDEPVEPDWAAFDEGAGDAPDVDVAQVKVPYRLVEAALHLLLHYPHLGEVFKEDAVWLASLAGDAEVDLLIKLLALLADNPGASRSRLLGLWHGRYGENQAMALFGLADRERWVANEMAAREELLSIRERLKARASCELPLEQLIQKSRAGQLTEWEKQELARLLRERH